MDPIRHTSSTGPAGPAKAPASAGVAAPAAPTLAAPAVSTLPVGATHLVHDGKIDCATTIKIAAPPEQVLAALQGDWTGWWKGGKVENRRPRADGGQDFDLKPKLIAGISPTFVHVHAEPPRAEALPEGGYKVVIPVKLGGDFVGSARWEIYASPEGGTTVRSVWENVSPTGLKAMGPMPHVVTRLHLAVEGAALENLKLVLSAKK